VAAGETMKEMKFKYGDAVILGEIDANGNSINRPASVVAITSVETEQQTQAFGYPLGTVLYTVEFGDGSDQLVPEDVLESTPSE
jgi:hypothetical protein